jgi:hypothetical protein
MDFLKQLGEYTEPHQIGIAEKLTEDQISGPLNFIRKFDARDIADLTFLHFLTLFILQSSVEFSVAAKGHAIRTLHNQNFKKLNYLGTDLNIFIHLVLGNSTDRLLKKPSNDIFYKRCHIKTNEFFNALYDIKTGQRYTTKINRFLNSLEKNLQIENANYRSCRRIISNWDDESTKDRKLAVTRILLALRSRYSKSDVLPHLEKFAKENSYELEHVKNPELMESTRLSQLGSLTLLVDEETSLEDLESIAASLGSKLSLSKIKNRVTISMISVPEKGKGTGSKILEMICKYADLNQLKLVLTPEKIEGTSSVERLERFYKRFGFVKNKGKEKDFSFMDAMYRNPKLEELEIITELFDKPSHFEISNSGKFFTDYKFSIDGNNYNAEVSCLLRDDKWNEIPEVAFSLQTNDNLNNIVDKLETSIFVNSSRVFATIYKIIKTNSIIKEKGHFFFTSKLNDRNRLKLYDFLSERLASALKMQVTIEDIKANRYYYYSNDVQKINEVFDNPVEFELLVSVSDYRSYEFKVENQKFELDIFEQSYDKDSTIAEVVFDLVQYHRGHMQRTQDIPATPIFKNSSKVFGTVIAIIKQDTLINKTIGVTFSSELNIPSRLKLYDAIAKHLARDMNMNLEIQDIPGTRVYKLLKKKKLTETFDIPVSYDIRKQIDNLFEVRFKSNNETYCFYAEQTSKDLNYWEIAYGYTESDRSINYNPKNNKGSIKVLSTIVDIIKKFISLYSPNLISFTADNKYNLRSLYNKMTTHLIKYFEQFGYHKKEVDLEDSTYFAFIKNSWNMGRIDESFDSKTDFKWTDIQKNERTAIFEINNIKYRIQFVNFKTHWSVYYGDLSKTGYNEEPNGLQGNNAIKVLGTVANIIEEFINDIDPDRIEFSGEKATKLGKLYSSILKHLSPYIRKLGYKIQTEFKNDRSEKYIYFSLTRIGHSTFYESINLTNAATIEQFNDFNDYNAKFEVNGKPFFIKFISGLSGEYYVEFGRTNSVSTFKPTNDMNTGGYFKVYSIVYSTIVEFIKTYSPKRLAFTGHKKYKLEKLYDKIMSNLITDISKLGYILSTQTNDIYTMYIFNKKANS